MLESWLVSSPSTQQIMLAAMLVVMFFGSTRFEETAALSVDAVEMMSSGNLRINFAKGKCNQNKELQLYSTHNSIQNSTEYSI